MCLCLRLCLQDHLGLPGKGGGGKEQESASAMPPSPPKNLSTFPAGAKFHPLDLENEGQSLLLATWWGG